MTEGDVRPSEGLYINAHGTSTKLNDSSETAALSVRGETGARRARLVDKVDDRSLRSVPRAPSRSWSRHGAEQGVVPPTINYHTP